MQAKYLAQCGIQKNGIDDLICKAERDTERENKLMGTQGERVEWNELGDWNWHTYTTDTMYKIDD